MTGPTKPRDDAQEAADLLAVKALRSIGELTSLPVAPEVRRAALRKIDQACRAAMDDDETDSE